ncbi:MAG: signal peptidase I [Clostridia bacterium]|nr:signal peptidase I [Clostridia bacterium]
MNSEEKFKRAAVAKIISTAFLCLTVALCLIVAVQVTTKGYFSFFGRSMFRVVTGSMEPTLPVGSILMCKAENIEDIEVDDIVCFKSRESGMLGRVITHRVLNVLENSDGTVLLETKGDANLSADGYLVNEDNFIGRVVWYAGEGSFLKGALSFITGKIGFLACIVFPILLLSGLILRDSVKNIKKDLNAAIDALVEETSSEKKDSLSFGEVFTEEEYREMYERIRAELMEELKQNEANQTPAPERNSEKEKQDSVEGEGEEH